MLERMPLEFRRDQLAVRVYPDRSTMGAAAGRLAAAMLRDVLAEPRRVARVLFAAAPSQLEALATLVGEPDIDWTRICAFHLDEYLGLPPGDDATFGAWLDQHAWLAAAPGRVEKLDPGAPDPGAECLRYGRLLADGGIDLALLGIGENGHVAFNEPHAASLDDPAPVAVVTLAHASRLQQVHDGTFADIADVPSQAMTVTMSTILASRAIVVTVPGARKSRGGRPGTRRSDRWVEPCVRAPAPPECCPRAGPGRRSPHRPVVTRADPEERPCAIPTAALGESQDGRASWRRSTRRPKERR